MIRSATGFSSCHQRACVVPRKASPAKRKISKMIPIKEITRPAMAKPLGFLKTPIKESIIPRNHNNHPAKGIHPKKSAINAKTNPAVPVPLD